MILTFDTPTVRVYAYIQMLSYYAIRCAYLCAQYISVFLLASARTECKTAKEYVLIILSFNVYVNNLFFCVLLHLSLLPLDDYLMDG